MSSKLSGIKGMNDLLPAQSGQWERLEALVIEWAHSFGFRNCRTPILELTPLFTRGIGAVTDVVEKEMYSFQDALNGDPLTLRPEMTAGMVRAAIEHHLTYERPQRLFALGPVFRHERPQKGRYRQFHQIDIETFGFPGPEMDVELILMAANLWKRLGLKNVRLEINTLGTAAERTAHRQALIAYFEAHHTQLDEDAQRRLHSNPLRILDTKNPTMQELVNNAPKLIDYLTEDSSAHFETVQSLLSQLNISFAVNPRLVRGLDYYSHTVFEWIVDTLGSQGTICGGGRFDGLFELLGGKTTPAAGFAIGFERLLEVWLQQEHVAHLADRECDVYIIHQGIKGYQIGLTLSEELRDYKLRTITHGMAGSFKAQMKRADTSGALVALIIGENEIEQQQVSVKFLRLSSSEQQVVYTLSETAKKVHHFFQAYTEN